MRAFSVAPSFWLLPQSGPDPFRGDLFVFLAFAAAWLLIGLWALSIGGKRSRLARQMKEDGGAAPGDRGS